MLAAESLQPPVAYSTIWSLLGWTTLVLGVAAIGWVVAPRRRGDLDVLVVTGRQRRVGEVPPPVDYATHLDAIEDAARRGIVDRRRVHHELSRTIRHQLEASTAVAATSMTVAELAAAGFVEAAAVLTSLRDGQFNRAGDGDDHSHVPSDGSLGGEYAEALAATRRVVLGSAPASSARRAHRVA